MTDYAPWDYVPWDGLATSVFVSAGEIQPEGETEGELGPVVPTPYLVISLYQGRDEIVGREFDIDLNRAAGASFCEAGGDCTRRPRAAGCASMKPRARRDSSESSTSSS